MKNEFLHINSICKMVDFTFDNETGIYEAGFILSYDDNKQINLSISKSLEILVTKFKGDITNIETLIDVTLKSDRKKQFIAYLRYVADMIESKSIVKSTK